MSSAHVLGGCTPSSCTPLVCAPVGFIEPTSVQSAGVPPLNADAAGDAPVGVEPVVGWKPGGAEQLDVVPDGAAAEEFELDGTTSIGMVTDGAAAVGVVPDVAASVGVTSDGLKLLAVALDVAAPVSAAESIAGVTADSVEPAGPRPVSVSCNDSVPSAFVGSPPTTVRTAGVDSVALDTVGPLVADGIAAARSALVPAFVALTSSGRTASAGRTCMLPRCA